MLQVSSVNRSFDERRVLDDISFEVAPGRMTGFVGANGAGKTTSMRIILGLLAADSGTVTWNGSPVTRNVRRRIGYMPEERGLYPKMKVREQLVYFGRLHGMTTAAARDSVDTLLAEVGLTERANDLLETLSLGNQQRAQIAAALVHDPVLLVLDEPFSGLDPTAVDTVVALLRERAARGVPVLFSSHQLDLVERLCDDLIIIAAGAVRASGNRRELRQRYATPRYEIVVDGDAGWMRDLPGVTMVDLDGERAVLDLGAPDGSPSQPVAGRPLLDDQALLREALSCGPVRSFRPVLPSLAEIFREVAR